MREFHTSAAFHMRTRPRCPLSRRLVGPERLSGHCAGQNNLAAFLRIEWRYFGSAALSLEQSIDAPRLANVTTIPSSPF
jgi:hypothetical protein